jgi:hypothetical protein
MTRAETAATCVFVALHHQAFGCGRFDAVHGPAREWMQEEEILPYKTKRSGRLIDHRPFLPTVTDR